MKYIFFFWAGRLFKDIEELEIGFCPTSGRLSWGSAKKCALLECSSERRRWEKKSIIFTQATSLLESSTIVNPQKLTCASAARIVIRWHWIAHSASNHLSSLHRYSATRPACHYTITVAVSFDLFFSHWRYGDVIPVAICKEDNAELASGVREGLITSALQSG